MCEMLVRTVDKAPLDTPDAHARVSQRGDVITIQEDGWNWSKLERENSFWKIVKLPNVTPQAMEAFLASEPGDPATNKYLRRRHFSFDLGAYDRLPPKAQSALNKESALSLKKQKPPVDDPSTIGSDSKVIG